MENFKAVSFILGILFTISSCETPGLDSQKNPGDQLVNNPSIAIPGETIVNQDNYLISSLTDTQILGAKSLRIYFEHASVGNNVIQGLSNLGIRDPRFLYGDSNRNSVNFDPSGETLTPNWFTEGSRFGDVSRGYPATGQLYALDKLAFFDTQLRGGIGDVVDVAMFKFCYLDGNLEGQALFDKVKTTMEALEAKYPKISLVWWTMPVQNWANLNSYDYNGLVRKYCQDNKKWLLDIADLETRDAEGNQFFDETNFQWTGTKIPVINPAYTQDNGHLNTAGADKVAQAWWMLLSLIADHRSGS